LSFRGGIFRFVDNWNALVPFGRGQLIVDDERHAVRYHVSFRQLTYAATIMVVFGAAGGWFATKHDPVVSLFFAFGWLWLVGGNLMIGIPRFQRFLRKAIDNAPIGTRSVGQ